MNIRDIFDPDFRPRTAAEWRDILAWAANLLGEAIGATPTITSWTIEDDPPGHGWRDNGVDVTFDTQHSLGYVLCGCVCCGVNVGEAVWIDADLLAFTEGRRVPALAGQHLIYIAERDAQDGLQWRKSGWEPDANGEWDSYEDDSRWRTPPVA